MIWTRLSAATLLALLVNGPLAAQQKDDPAVAPEKEQAAETDNTADSNQESTPQTPPAPQKAEDSPFDYRSSEQISEDLSVSFPVDI